MLKNIILTTSLFSLMSFAQAADRGAQETIDFLSSDSYKCAVEKLQKKLDEKAGAGYLILSLRKLDVYPSYMDMETLDMRSDFTIQLMWEQQGDGMDSQYFADLNVGIVQTELHDVYEVSVSSKKHYETMGVDLSKIDIKECFPNKPMIE